MTAGFASATLAGFSLAGFALAMLAGFALAMVSDLAGFSTGAFAGAFGCTAFAVRCWCDGFV